MENIKILSRIVQTFMLIFHDTCPLDSYAEKLNCNLKYADKNRVFS
jgi:hypothetical protein